MLRLVSKSLSSGARHYIRCRPSPSPCGVYSACPPARLRKTTRALVVAEPAIARASANTSDAQVVRTLPRFPVPWLSYSRFQRFVVTSTQITASRCVKPTDAALGTPGCSPASAHAKCVQKVLQDRKRNPNCVTTGIASQMQAGFGHASYRAGHHAKPWRYAPLGRQKSLKHDQYCGQ